MLSGAGCPRVERPATKLIQLPLIGDFLGGSFDDDTPAGVVQRTAVVDLKDDRGAACDRTEF